MDKSSKKHSKFVLFLVMTAIVVLLIYVFKEISLLFFGSYVISCALNPLVDKMSKVMPRWLAIAIIYIMGLVTILLIAIPLILVAIEETAALLRNLPVYLDFIKNAVLYVLKQDIPALNLLFNFNTVSHTVERFGTELLNQSINLTKSLIEGATISLTVAIIVLYMLLDKPVLKEGILSFFPEELRGKIHSMGKAISYKVGGYVIGQVFIMLVVGILTGMGLFLFKIKFAALLGLTAGLLDIVPIAGPFLALTMGILVAAPLGLKAIVTTFFIYIFAQWSTNHFLKPVLFGKLLDLHPIIIILAILVAAQTLGVAGVILSPAIAATLYVIFQEFYLKVINKKSDDENS